MTPLWLQLALPAVQLVAAGLIAYRFSWRDHPALIAYLFTEFTCQSLAYLHISNRDLAIMVQLVVRLAVLLEVLTFARIRITRNAYCGVAAAVIATCWWASGLWGWSHAYRVYAFRSYYLLVVFAVALAVTLYRWYRPLRDIWRVRQRRGFELMRKTPECFRHKAYRVGVTVWLGTVAVAGSTVAGSVGEWLFPYRHYRRVQELIGLAACVSLVATVAVMTIAMCHRGSGRTRMAKVADDWRTERGRLAA